MRNEQKREGCPFTKEDFKNNPNREEGHLTSEFLSKYITEAKAKGIKDCVIGFVIGWTAEEVSIFYEDIKK